MLIDQFGGVWLTDPLALLTFGVAVFALLGAAHHGVAADARAASESRLARRLAVLDELSAAFAAAVAMLDAPVQPGARRPLRSAERTSVVAAPAEQRRGVARVKPRAHRERQPVRVQGWNNARAQAVPSDQLVATAPEQVKTA